MNKKQITAMLLIAAVGAALAVVIYRIEPGQRGAAKGGGTSEASHGHGVEKEAKGGRGQGGHGKEAEHAHGSGDAGTKGPHGGRLLSDGAFAIEVVFAESARAKSEGAALKAYLFENGKPLSPGAATVTVTLTRPAGEKQEIRMQPQGDALVGSSPIAPPFVFEATVAAQKQGEPYLFTFSREEGLIALTDQQVESAGIVLEAAGPAKLATVVSLPGEIQFDQDRTAHVVPRVSGVVEGVPVQLGAQVQKGQVIAVIASTAVSEQRSELAAAQRRLELARSTFEREKKLWEEKITAQQDYLQARTALQEAEIAVNNMRQKLAAIGVTPQASAGNRFELRAPLSGVVVEKHVTLGEAVSDSTNIFTIADLSFVWATFNVPASDLAAVRVGQAAIVRAPALGNEVSGKVSYVGSLVGEQTRTAAARVTLANPQGAWRPGVFVTVTLTASEREAPVTVPTSALQTANGQAQVFLRVPGGFVAQAVQTGASDGRRTEIIRGLSPGAAVAASGSFVLKSEGEKGSSESHSH